MENDKVKGHIIEIVDNQMRVKNPTVNKFINSGILYVIINVKL
jgi:hypothetical protein